MTVRKIASLNNCIARWKNNRKTAIRMIVPFIVVFPFCIYFGVHLFIDVCGLNLTIEENIFFVLVSVAFMAVPTLSYINALTGAPKPRRGILKTI